MSFWNTNRDKQPKAAPLLVLLCNEYQLVVPYYRYGNCKFDVLKIIKKND